MASQLDLSRRQPLLPLGSDFAVQLLRRGEAGPLQGRRAHRARAHRRQVRLAEGARHPRRARRAGGPRVRRRALRARPRDAPRWRRRRGRSGWARATARSTSTSRSGETYNTTNGCGTEVIDWHTGERRQPTKDDLCAITRMIDYLGSVQFWWPNVAAADKGDTHTLHELDAAWNNTASTCRAWCRASARPATRSRWRR